MVGELTNCQEKTGFIPTSHRATPIAQHPMASPPVVLFERRGHVGIFTLNRPSAMNAVSGEVAETMERLMDAFEA